MVGPDFQDYSSCMSNQIRVVKSKSMGLVLGAVLMAMPIEFTGTVRGGDSGLTAPLPMVQGLAVLTPSAPLAPPVSVAPSAPTAPPAPVAPTAPTAPVAPTAPAAPLAPPVALAPSTAAPVEIPDDYVYYPNYGVYYNPHQHLYHYLKGDAWVTGPAPEGISEKAFQTSPWVKMDFHDAPARHHAAILKKYPRDWKPAAVPVSPGPAPQNLKP